LSDTITEQNAAFNLMETAIEQLRPVYGAINVPRPNCGEESMAAEIAEAQARARKMSQRRVSATTAELGGSSADDVAAQTANDRNAAQIGSKLLLAKIRTSKDDGIEGKWNEEKMTGITDDKVDQATYDRSSGADGVMGMLATIAQQTSREICERTKEKVISEKEKQATNAEFSELLNEANMILGPSDSGASLTQNYNQLVEDVENKDDLLNNPLDSIAPMEAGLIAKTLKAQGDLDATEERCNFILKNYNTIQQAQQTEIQQMNEMIAFLDGMKNNDFADAKKAGTA